MTKRDLVEAAIWGLAGASPAISYAVADTKINVRDCLVVGAAFAAAFAAYTRHPDRAKEAIEAQKYQ